MSNESKINLCVLKTQLGKTYQAIKRIMKEIDSDEENGRSIHIVHTMNTLLNNKQFVSRLYKIQRKYGENAVVILSSDKSVVVDEGENGKYKKYVQFWNKKLDKDVRFPQFKTLDELKLSITLPMAEETHENIPKVIVMCCNKTRFEDMFGRDGLVKFLETSFQKKKKKDLTPAIERVFSYIDEMHEYISDNLRGKLEFISQFDVVESIIGFTATPDPIFIPNDPFWGSLSQIDLTNYNDSNYVGASDQDWIVMDEYEPFWKENYRKPGPFDHEKKAKDVIGFMEHVFEKHHKSIFKPKARIFAPGHTKEDSHTRIMKLIFSYSPECVVILLNSKNKMIVFQDENRTEHLRQISSLEKQSGEVADDIYEILVKNNLENRPVCYTGMLCIGMGQTLVSKKFGRFTTAILSHLDLRNDSLYQVFGRITGNSRDWSPEFVLTSIYCPSVTMNRCRAMEECASMMVDYQGKTIDRETYRTMMKSSYGQDCLDNMPKDKKVVKPKVVLDKYLGDMKVFKLNQDEQEQTENDILSYLREMIGDTMDGYAKEKLNSFMTEVLNNLEKNEFTKRALRGKESKVQTYAELKEYAKGVSQNPSGAFGETAKNKDTNKMEIKLHNNAYNVRFFPAYENNDLNKIWIGARWILLKEKPRLENESEEVNKDDDSISQTSESSSISEKIVGSKDEPSVKVVKRRTKIVEEDKKNQVLEEIECTIEEFKSKVEKAKNGELQDWCKKFGIPKAGNKTELQQKLLNLF